MSFREQNALFLKSVILLAFGLGMCEGVGEDSGHGIGHVDIRVCKTRKIPIYGKRVKS